MILQAYRQHHYGQSEEPYHLLVDSASLVRTKRGGSTGHRGGRDDDNDDDDVPSITEPPLVRLKRIKRDGKSSPTAVAAAPHSADLAVDDQKEHESKHVVKLEKSPQPPPSKGGYRKGGHVAKSLAGDGRVKDLEKTSKMIQKVSKEGRSHIKGSGSSRPAKSQRNLKPSRVDNRLKYGSRSEKEALEEMAISAIQQAQRARNKNRSKERGSRTQGTKKMTHLRGGPGGRQHIDPKHPTLVGIGAQHNSSSFAGRAHHEDRTGRQFHRLGQIEATPVGGHQTPDRSRLSGVAAPVDAGGRSKRVNGGKKKQSKHRGGSNTAGVPPSRSKELGDGRVEHELLRMKRMQRDLVNEISRLEQLKTHRGRVKNASSSSGDKNKKKKKKKKKRSAARG